MDPDVTLGMKLRGLRDTLHRGDFRENLDEKAEFIQKFESAPGLALGEQLGEFLANALGGDNTNFVGVFADGSEGCGFDGVAEARGETDGTEHAEFVFGESAGRFADSPDDFGGEIIAAADEIEDFTGVVAHEKAVNGEIAALDVFFGRLGIDDLVGMAAIGVTEVGAKRGDFDFEGILADEDYAELCADVETLGEKPQNFLRRCICCHVEIRGLALEEDVANASANEKGLVPLALERGANRIGEFARIHETIMRLWREVNEAGEAKEVKEGSEAAVDCEMFGVRIRSSGERGR